MDFDIDVMTAESSADVLADEAGASAQLMLRYRRLSARRRPVQTDDWFVPAFAPEIPLCSCCARITVG